MAGKDHVIAGSFRTKAQAAVAGMMSQEMRAQAHRGMAQPGSGLDGSADGENG
jgi:hypothetical protein